MPHQEQGRECNRNQTNYLAIGETIQWLFAGTRFSGVRFREDSQWKPRSLAATALLWVWSCKKGLTGRFTAARKIAAHIFPWLPKPPGSYQAFTKMLVRWTTALLVLVFNCLRRRMLEDLADYMRLCGYMVFGVDGSRVELPRTVGNEQRFGAKRKKKRKKSKARKRRSRRGSAQATAKKINSPQMWVTTMWHARTGLPWDWRSGPSDSSEREHMLQMIDALPANSLVTADPGFVGYTYWKALLAAGHQMVIRVGSNVRFLKRLGYVRESGATVYLWPNKAARKEQLPLALRLVELHNGKHPVYLATSVLSRTQLSDRQAAEIYKARWGVELFYRSFKQTFNRCKLRSHNPEHAQVEFDWSMVGLWAVCLRTLCQLVECGEKPERLSVAGALRAFQEPMCEPRCRPEAGEDHWTLMEAAVLDSYQRRDKTSRDYPRKKTKETIPGKPKLQTATRRQRHIVAKIKITQAQIGLTA